MTLNESKEYLKKKEHFSFSDFELLLKVLRSPEGCPWDQEQTHKSIRKNFIEETYEAIEAIDTNNSLLLREELGDVLLQIGLHACMAAENGEFTIHDVLDDECKKMIQRHPHVFGETKLNTAGEVLNTWDGIKVKEKKQKSVTDTMESISKALPALMLADKVGHKAAKVGFDFPTPQESLKKVKEELQEVEEALEENNREAIAEEFGDLLFSVVNSARLAGVDSEEVLYKACNKFIKRFSKVEQMVAAQNSKMTDLSLNELDILWEQAKKM